MAASRKVRVNMTDVESFGKASEGIHTAKLQHIESGSSQGGDPCLKARFEITKGDDKGVIILHQFMLGEKSLWVLKQFLDAIGMKSDGKLTLDLDKMEGKVCNINVFHDAEWNDRSKISEFTKVGKKAIKEDVDDDDEEYDDDYDEDDEEEEKPKKKAPAKKTAPKKTTKKKPEPEDDDEEEDEDWDEDDDEEEDEPPKKKAPAKKAPAKKAAPKKKSKPVEEDEDDDWEDEEDDDDDWEDA